MGDPVQAKGSLFRGYVAAIRAAGVLDAVKARLSDETRRLVEEPPLISTWIDCRHQDELIVAYAALRGLEASSEMGHALTRDSLSPFLRPVVSLIMRLAGPSPHKVFARLDQISSTNVKPLTWAYYETGATSGRIRLAAPRPFPEAGLYSWRGGFRYAFDLCRVKGDIERPVTTDGGRTTTFEARWS